MSVSISATLSTIGWEATADTNTFYIGGWFCENTDLTLQPTWMELTNVGGGGFALDRLSGTGDLRFRLSDGGVSPNIDLTLSGVVTAGTWIHIGVVWLDGGTNLKRMLVYLNGSNTVAGDTLNQTMPTRGNIDRFYIGSGAKVIQAQDVYVATDGVGVRADGDPGLMYKRIMQGRVWSLGRLKAWYPFHSGPIAAASLFDYARRASVTKSLSGGSASNGTTNPGVPWGGPMLKLDTNKTLTADGGTASDAAATVQPAYALVADSLTQTAGSAAVAGFGSAGGAGGFGGVHRRGALTRRAIR